MGGEQKPFRWMALFRDGHTIEQQAAHDPSAFQSLVNYLNGTPEDPRRRYLVWFKVTNDELDYTVSFDRDGDAYIDLPDGKMLMTEFKMRSAQLIYQKERDHLTDRLLFWIGFGGLDSRGVPGGRCISVLPDGSYKLAEVSAAQHAMI